jgi:hypothetical protein
MQEEHGRLRATGRVLSDADNLFDVARFNFVNLHFWDDENLNPFVVSDYLKTTKPAYFIISYQNDSELQNDLAQSIVRGAQRLIHYDNGTAEVLAANPFELLGLGNNKLFSIKRFGQFVDVYRPEYQ